MFEWQVEIDFETRTAKHLRYFTEVSLDFILFCKYYWRQCHASLTLAHFHNICSMIHVDAGTCGNIIKRIKLHVIKLFRSRFRCFFLLLSFGSVSVKHCSASYFNVYASGVVQCAMCNEYFINITSFRLPSDQIVSVSFPNGRSLKS